MDDAPRVQDLRIAEALEFAQPRDIRKLIERNREELQSHGEVCATVAQTSPNGGRPGNEYWLNEPQSLLICMFSRTDKAAEVRREIIEVFMAWRRGHLAPPLAPGVAPPPFDFPAEGGPLQAYALKLDTVRLCARVHGIAVARAMWNALALPAVPGHEPEKSDEAKRCLDHLLSDMSYGGRALREWIEIAIDGDDGEIVQHLRDEGIFTVSSATDAGFVVANRRVASRFAGTPWRENYSYVLRRLPGARADKRHFGRAIGEYRGTFVPADLLAPKP